MSERRASPRRAVRLAALALSIGFIAGISLGSAGLLPVPDVSVRWSIPALGGDDYVPGANVGPGEELLFVYVGSSTCGWSNRPEMPPLVRGLKADMGDRATEMGIGFAAVGIARDRRTDAGLAHLEKFGPFDE